jgi:hypothetical protein
MEFACFRRFDELPPQADSTFASTENNGLFATRAWYEMLLQHAGIDERTVRLACVIEHDRLLALLPLVEVSTGQWSTLRHRYTSHYPLPIPDDRRDAIIACLATGLAAQPLRSLLLEPVADDEITQSLQQAMTLAGFDCQRHFRFYNWVHRPDGQSYDAYFAGRPSRLRNTIARKRRKLEREHLCSLQVSPGDDIADALDAYHAVYRASWKANEQHRPLIDALAKTFAARGCSRVGVLSVDDKPIAAQLWFVVGGHASIFRLAYDTRWKSWSPGSILTAHLMAHVIDNDKVSEIDFLTGNEAYKQDWMTQRRERGVLSCTRPEQKMPEPLGRFARLAAVFGAGRR